MNKLAEYGWNILIAIDQLVNTLCGGDPDETLSSRMGKWSLDGENQHGVRRIVYIVANWVVEKFQKDHFKKSIEPNEGNRKVID